MCFAVETTNTHITDDYTDTVALAHVAQVLVHHFALEMSQIRAAATYVQVCWKVTGKFTPRTYHRCTYSEQAALVQPHLSRAFGCWSCQRVSPAAVVWTIRSDDVTLKCSKFHQDLEKMQESNQNLLRAQS